MKNDDVVDLPKWKYRIRQLFAVLSPLMSAFVIGLSAELYHYTSTMEFFSSLNTGAVLLGNLLSGIGMELLGRKRFTVFGYLVSALGWAIMAFAHVTIGKAICYLGTGLLSPLVPVYITEISKPAYRSIFLSLIQAASTLGFSLVALLDVLIVHKVMYIICTILILIMCLIICFMSRESPIWLMNKGRAKEAMNEWVYLRGSKSLNEYRAMERAPLKGTLFSKQFLWPLAVSCVVFFVYRFCTFKLIKYVFMGLMEFFRVQPLHTVLFVLSVVNATDIIVCFIISTFSRRSLTMSCALGTFCSLLLLYLSFWFRLDIVEYILCSLSYLVFMLGLQPLPLIICGELFPRNLRSIGASLSCSFSTICLFVHELLVLPMLIEDVDRYERYATFSVSMILALIFLWWKLPETEDKTLLEIEQAFDKKPEKTDAATIKMIGHHSMA